MGAEVSGQGCVLLELGTRKEEVGPGCPDGQGVQPGEPLPPDATARHPRAQAPPGGAGRSLERELCAEETRFLKVMLCPRPRKPRSCGRSGVPGRLLSKRGPASVTGPACHLPSHLPAAQPAGELGAEGGPTAAADPGGASGRRCRQGAEAAGAGADDTGGALAPAAPPPRPACEWVQHPPPRTAGLRPLGAGLGYV
ncbi:PREDICTED: cuticle collagen 40-like [Chinchilla lanigera]|uniref:cuticle collagen 40-like n=1 Tax=Chinchilla lanigera TaxID=34839 RepID=UPI000695DF29|nr:PREDICTED: cuticle collagen 40-like [Chinchilla lanigera]